MRVGRQQRVAKGICGREEGRTTPKEREESGTGSGGVLSQSKGSNSSRVNSEIGSRDLLTESPSKGSQRRRLCHSTYTWPRSSERVQQAAEPARAASFRAPTFLPLLAPQCLLESQTGGEDDGARQDSDKT